MIENKTAAAEVSALMLHIGALINVSLESVKARCSAAEADRYQSACDTVLMNILMEIVNPIYDLHPELMTGVDAVESDASTGAHRAQPGDSPRRAGRPRRRQRLVRSTPYSPGGRL